MRISSEEEEKDLPKKIYNVPGTLEFSEFAKDDLDETWLYLSELASGAADRLIDELYQVCELIAANPYLGSARNEIIVDLRLLPHKNFNVYYFPTENGVEIFRVLHSSRDIIQIFDDSIDDIP